MQNNKAYKAFELTIEGKDVDVDELELTQEDANYLMGQAKQYTNEGEHFETMEPDVNEANRCYENARRLEILVAEIRKRR